MNSAQRPWLASYAQGVPAEIDLHTGSLVEELESAAAQWPSRVALDFFGRQTTYDELMTQVRQAATTLLEHGVKAGDRVALILPNSPAHVVAFYAVLHIGAIVVENNPTYTATELRGQLADSQSTAAIVWHHAVPRFEQARAELAEQGQAIDTVFALDIAKDLPLVKQFALTLPIKKARETAAAMRGPKHTQLDWHKTIAKAEPLREDYPRPETQDVALLQYTGGTTGTPKAAILTHHNLIVNVRQGRAWTQAQGGTEVVYGVLPFFHAFGLTLCLTYSVSLGATLVLFPKFDAEAFFAAQRRLPCTFLPAVPTMLGKLNDAAAHTKVDLSSIRFTIAGAMALPGDVAAKWEELTGGLAIEGYGMTETSPVALGSPLNEARRPGTLGLPFPSTDIRITSQDDPHTLAAPGEIGELQIRGPQVFGGYWRKPEETAAQLLEDCWLRTGDLVTVDESGFVTLMDRSKEMIISGGFKVYPSQVEEKIRLMPGVQDVAVVGVPAGARGESVVAALVLEVGSHIDLDALREWCSDKLAKYAIPHSVVILTELPRSQVGKVLRRVVREGVVGQTV